MVSEYKDAGVDLNKLKEIHRDIASAISSTYRRTVLGAGHYSGVVEINGLKLAIHVDGVGTKVLLAKRARKYRSVGIDCVAMNVNDLISIGAKPIALVDYIAMDQPSEEVISEIVQGLVQGAKESDAEIVGGETAAMKDVVNGFDLSCTALGVVDKLKAGEEVSPGDVIIGLASNGVHANGYSLVRKLLDEGKLSWKDWEEELLKPTRIYVKPVLEVLELIKAAGHITGGSFSKLRRITNYSLELTLPDPPMIFKAIEQAGVSHEEMHRVFNMGIGMVAFVDRTNAEDVLRKLNPYVPSEIIGEVKDNVGQIKITTYKSQVLYL
ncbi:MULTISPECIES: phosphoribosylformylglycinamidine cyclo-ligase [Metallosphaera]|uniref:phosphoribosylformylglycinamidine cyclo-ligase n=1 Tax=Metallosphaera TaxID=41980 RepID=UPI001F05DAD1|nr:phosphoribosylformylglycinamidine cyclo-ligase [Metallosphaera sedula]MCH1770742.1 phosphoribosylformylglycinamidine cyclo-ligase [Metallosphaera sedula]MCP6728941.1 phosphoribosylformylglycinamidine cyclo-ligase [Metallosphaera sedula]